MLIGKFHAVINVGNAYVIIIIERFMFREDGLISAGHLERSRRCYLI